MTDIELEPHELDPDAFDLEIHSFDFWFGAVRGYLSDRPYGHGSDLSSDAELEEGQRDRLITTLCNYCIGETAALEGAGGLVRHAPNRNAKIFMATQGVDEARHLEVFLHRLEELGVRDPEAEIAARADPALSDFRAALLGLIDEGDWNAAVFAQNVILETMEFTVFRAHAATADPVTAEVLRGVISDERRHFGFGQSHIGAGVVTGTVDPARLRELRGRFEPLVLRVFEEAMTSIGVPAARRADLGRDYLQTLDRLGLTA